jgi:hypothetical protein
MSYSYSVYTTSSFYQSSYSPPSSSSPPPPPPTSSQPASPPHTSTPASPPPTSSPSPPPPPPPSSTSVPAPATTSPQPNTSIPASNPPPGLSPIPNPQPAPPSNSNSAPPANVPGNGGQPAWTGAAPPGNNPGTQPTQSSAPSNNYSVSQSTWVTVYSATPTTMTFATQTTLGGSTFDTTWAVTTSFGGVTSTLSSNIPVRTGGSGAGSVHSTNNVGAVVGSIAGAIVLAFFTLFMCKVYHNRRTVTKQERQMTESWLSLPFSRVAARHRYRDIEMPSDVPAAYGHRNSYQDTAHDALLKEANDYVTSTPTSPTSSTPPASFPKKKKFLFSEHRKPTAKLVDVQNISGPVGPVTVQGDTTALRSALESTSKSQVPFLEPSGDDHNEELTNASRVTFYHVGPLVVDPFSDPVSGTSSSSGSSHSN